ncbi:halo-CC-star protein HcsL [Haloarcula sediminis]|uniref:halo-CC-star protein HcsL n=1 Tax=Haloarcula sediminis TaxID=3111777 RepID=UPI002D77C837|nr:halo-CC-star protein HcsL [Haloarcula sp. CK38]
MSEIQSSEAAVEEQLRTFMETLTDSETYQEFVEASEALEADSEASALVREFQQKQQRMQRGGFDQSVMSELQDLQSEMDDNETIQRHREAQKALVELLQETNDVISEQIGREFAQSMGGGCC